MKNMVDALRETCLKHNNLILGSPNTKGKTGQVAIHFEKSVVVFFPVI